MLKLYKLEWMVWRKSSVFKISFALSTFCLIALPVYLNYNKNKITQRVGNMFAEAFDFPNALNTVSVISLISIHIFSLMLINIICQEYEFSTHRIHIINGVKKERLWLSKVLICLAMSLFVVFVAAALSFLFGAVNGGDFEFAALKWPGILFIQSFAYFSFAVTLSLVIRRTGTAIMVYLLWFLVFERIIAQYGDFAAGLYPLFRILPGKNIEDLSYLIVLKEFVVQRTDYFGLRFFAAMVWIAFSLVINRRIYMKGKYHN